MPVWELSPADNEKIVISLDADTREEAINKAKEISPEYERWIAKKVGYSDIEEREKEVASPKKEIKSKREIKPKAGEKEKKKKDEIIVLDL